MAAGETARSRRLGGAGGAAPAGGGAGGGGRRSPSRLICAGGIGGAGRTANCDRCHSSTFSSRVRLLLSLAFNSSLVGCTARAVAGRAGRLGDAEPSLGLTAPFGGGAFLFFAEQTEHDSSEQLLTDEPDGEDCFLGSGGEGGLFLGAGGGGCGARTRGRTRGDSRRAGERARGLRRPAPPTTGLRLIGLLLGLRLGVRRCDFEREFLGDRRPIGDLERLPTGVRERRPTGERDRRATNGDRERLLRPFGDLDLRPETGDRERLGDTEPEPSKYICL